MTRTVGFVRSLAATSIALGAVLLIAGVDGKSVRLLTLGELNSLRGASQHMWLLATQSCNTYNANQVSGTAIPGVPKSGSTKFTGSDACGQNNQGNDCVYCGDLLSGQTFPQPKGPNNQVVSSTAGGTDLGMVDAKADVSCGAMSTGNCGLDSNGQPGCILWNPNVGQCGNATRTVPQVTTPCGPPSPKPTDC